MQLHLVDINPRLVVAWDKSFQDHPEVTVTQAEMLSLAQHCLVSPANSYGFMDGGIDAAYRSFFGPQIERQVQDAVNRRPEGHLPVGASLVIHTHHTRIPYLIIAPTMTVPEMVDGTHSYRAMRAILRAVIAHPEIGTQVYCPGLATGVGQVPPQEAAAEMARAYADWKSTLK